VATFFRNGITPSPHNPDTYSQAGPKLDHQQKSLSEVYDRGDERTSVVDTRNKTPSEVAKEIARIIHLSKFVETPLHEWLEEYANNS